MIMTTALKLLATAGVVAVSAVGLAVATKPVAVQPERLTVSAPVVGPVGPDGTMRQIGRYTYVWKAEEGVVVLFCIRKPDAKSQTCIIYVKDGPGGLITAVEGVRPTEENT